MNSMFMKKFKQNLRDIAPFGIGMLLMVIGAVITLILSITIGKLFALIWVPLGVIVGIAFACFSIFLVIVSTTTLIDVIDRR